MTRAAILSIGTSTPAGSILQNDAADLVLAPIDDPRRARAVRGLFNRAGVDSRGSVLVDPHGVQTFYGDSGEPTTSERMGAYRTHAGTLAIDASRRALERAGVGARSITHLVTASCTGFDAPGPDQAIARALGLSPGVRRVCIGFMGCHAAINALRVADSLARSEPGARVLVCCVELCSLHLVRGDELDRHVPNALFADGAAAVVVAASDRSGRGIVATDSVLIPDSVELMAWRIGDRGFEMTLSPKVPGVLAEHVPPWVDGVLSRRGLARDDIDAWAIHPGGPRVLERLSAALGLAPGADAVSRRVLREHGNMSSATLLFILERLMATQDPCPILAMAFGPGLAGEALLLGAL